MNARAKVPIFEGTAMIEEPDVADARVCVTKPGPQTTLICCAALTYVVASALFLFAVAVSNTAIVRCRHESHVGLELAGRLMFRGR